MLNKKFCPMILEFMKNQIDSEKIVRENLSSYADCLILRLPNIRDDLLPEYL